MDFDFDFNSLNMPQQLEKKTYEKDTRFWKISKNDDGRGVAIIRLLPDANKVPFVRLYGYSLKGKYNPTTKKNAWYIANSPASINLPDPVAERYAQLMAEGTKEAETEAKTLKRNTKFYSNILVVNDPGNPENNGKVFLWEFGTKMKDKLMAWMNPSEEELALGEKKRALFNPISGNNIKLKIAPQGEWSSYDGSEVLSDITSIKEGITKEEAVNFIMTKTYDLNEFLSPAYYETYEELTKKLATFLGTSSPESESYEAAKEAAKTPAKAPVAEEDDDFVTETAPEVVAEKPKAKAKTAPKAASSTASSAASSEDDGWLDNL